MLLFLLSLLFASPAGAAMNSSPHRFVDLANGSRSGAGLASYDVAGDLSEVARHQAVRMATAHKIFHNPNLKSEVADWYMVGENVGVGYSPEQIHDAFMASPTHRADLLSQGFLEMGVGTAVGDDRRLYVSEVFRLREAPAAPAPAADTAEPAAAPSPAPPPPAAAPAPPSVAPPASVSAVPAVPAVPVAATVEVSAPTPTAVDARDLTELASSRTIASSAEPRPRPQWGALAASLIATFLAFGVLSAHVRLQRRAPIG